MSVESYSSKISDPEYFHREYKNDLPLEESGNYYIDQCKRVTLVALPFLSLYKPLSFPLSLTLGGFRTVSSLLQLIGELQNGDLQEISYALLQTTFAVVALSGTILAHPLGMLITTVHDCALDCFSIGQNLYSGDIQSALGSSANLLNNTLYLALFTHGGLEIAIASLAMQILIGLWHSVTEYQTGDYFEASGHLLMGMIRSHQMLRSFEILQSKSNTNNSCDVTEHIDSTNLISDENEEKIIVKFAGLNIKGSERDTLYEECRRLREWALYQANGCNSHLIGLYITQYLTSVNTPTALQLLNELKARKFVM